MGDESGSGEEGTRLAGDGVGDEGGGSTIRGVGLSAAIGNVYCESRGNLGKFSSQSHQWQHLGERVVLFSCNRSRSLVTDGPNQESPLGCRLPVKPVRQPANGGAECIHDWLILSSTTNSSRRPLSHARTPSLHANRNGPRCTATAISRIAKL